MGEKQQKHLSHSLRFLFKCLIGVSVVKMNSNNTTKRFIVGRKRTPTNLPINLEATKELREKLERFAEKKKEALHKVVLEKKILENWESEQPDVEDIRELVNQA